MKLYYEKQQKKCNLVLAEYSTQQVITRKYLHWHKMVEICLMVEGRCDILINGQKYIANEGDLIVVNSGDIHWFIHSFGNCKTDACIFDPIILYNLAEDIGSIIPLISREELDQAGITQAVLDCFQLMRREKDSTQPCSQLLFQSGLIQLYGLLLRHFSKAEPATQSDMAQRVSFQQVLEYISQNYTETLTLDALSKQFNYSSGYLCQLFRRCAGVNFKQYVDNIRVMEAAKLLCSSQLSITEIASACGFENIRTFNNVFKRLTGCSPSEARKKGY